MALQTQSSHAVDKMEAAGHIEDVNELNEVGFKTYEEKNLVRKQDLRIMPLSAGIFLLCYLDRSNIGRPLSIRMEDLMVIRHADNHRKCKDAECQYSE
jgi:hypothetical protein